MHEGCGFVLDPWALRVQNEGDALDDEAFRACVRGGLRDDGVGAASQADCGSDVVCVVAWADFGWQGG